MIDQDSPAETHRRVRVWFGEHLIVDYEATAENAERYAAAMSRRFASLRITNELVQDGA